MPPVRDITPEDRFRTVARILARGVVRLIEIERHAAIHDAESSKTPPDSLAGPLEVLDETRLSVSRFQGLSVRDQQ